MAVVMNRSQQHGRRDKRIDTRHPGRQILKVRFADGENTLVVFFVAIENLMVSLAFSSCGVQDKLSVVSGQLLNIISTVNGTTQLTQLCILHLEKHVYNMFVLHMRCTITVIMNLS